MVCQSSRLCHEMLFSELTKGEKKGQKGVVTKAEAMFRPRASVGTSKQGYSCATTMNDSAFKTGRNYSRTTPDAVTVKRVKAGAAARVPHLRCLMF
jgi:hypothetical protein